MTCTKALGPANAEAKLDTEFLDKSVPNKVAVWMGGAWDAWSSADDAIVMSVVQAKVVDGKTLALFTKRASLENTSSPSIKELLQGTKASLASNAEAKLDKGFLEKIAIPTAQLLALTTSPPSESRNRSLVTGLLR